MMVAPEMTAMLDVFFLRREEGTCSCLFVCFCFWWFSNGLLKGKMSRLDGKVLNSPEEGRNKATPLLLLLLLLLLSFTSPQ